MYTSKEHVLFGVVLRFAQIVVVGFHTMIGRLFR
jgi:hypothetical protein